MKYALLLLILPACFPIYPFKESTGTEPGPSGPTGTPDPTFNTIALASDTITLHANDRVVLGLMTSGTQVQVGTLPAGVNVVATTSTLTFTTDATVIAGSTQVSVTASSDTALAGAVALTLTLVATPRLSLSPAQQSILRGSNATITVTVARDAGFAGVATIEVLDLGSLMTGAVAPLQAQESERVITLTSSAQASPSVTTVRVRVTHAGAALPDASTTITVTAAPGTQDFAFGLRSDQVGSAETYPTQALIRADDSALLLVSTNSPAPDNRAMAQLLTYENEAEPTVLAEFFAPGVMGLQPHTMRFDSMGRIVVLGTLTDPPNNLGIYMARLLPDGTRDPSFGTLGEISINLLPGDAYATCALAGLFERGTDLYITGKAAAVGQACEDAAQTKSFVVRVNDAGTPQSPTSVTHTELNAYNQSLYASAEDANGQVVVVGGSSHAPTFSVALAHGYSTLVPPTTATNGFSNRTISTNSSDGYDTFFSAASTLGGFYMAGVANHADWGASSHQLVARILSNGLPDTSFNSEGFTHLPIDALTLGAEVRVVLNDTANRALLAGTHVDDQNQKRTQLCRLTLGGALDTAFATNGCTLINHGTGDSLLGAAALDSLGRVWLFSALAGQTTVLSARYFAN